jgi:hypothetical protein
MPPRVTRWKSRGASGRHVRPPAADAGGGRRPAVGRTSTARAQASRDAALREEPSCRPCRSAPSVGLCTDRRMLLYGFRSAGGPRRQEAIPYA